MIGLALTLDYEVYGDGEGSLNELAVRPTAKFLEICDGFNAKTTLFVDAAEILAMKKIKVFKLTLRLWPNMPTHIKKIIKNIKR